MAEMSGRAIKTHFLGVECNFNRAKMLQLVLVLRLVLKERNRNILVTTIPLITSSLGRRFPISRMDSQPQDEDESVDVQLR